MTKTPEPFGMIAHPKRYIRIIHRDGQTWFATTDVLSILGYANSGNAIILKKVPADHIYKSRHLGSTRRLVFTSGEGIALLCQRSDKPGALRLLTWLAQRVPELADVGQLPEVSRRRLANAPSKTITKATVTLTREELAKLVAMAGEAGAAAAIAVTTQATAAQRPTPPLDAFKITPTRPSR